MRRRNDVPRTVVLATLVLEGLRISELCALDGEDLDFAGRRIYVPRLRRTGDGRLVRVQGIKTEAAERIIQMLPSAYDLLLDHKTSFDFGPKDPVFATRNGRRNTVDNVRRTIVDGSVLRANELLAEREQRPIVTCTPHTLRPDLRLDRGRAEPSAKTSDVPHRAHRPDLDHARLSAGPGHERRWRAEPRESHRLLADRRLRPALLPWGSVPESSPERKKKRPAAGCLERAGRARKPLGSGRFKEAAEGTRTLDLLHGKQTL
jgi:Phage integrase family